MRPRLLDLFCGAGGCSMGYHRAGFDVTGVDIEPQKRYPFQFVCADALKYLAEFGHSFDAVAGSPPCQAHTRLNAMWNSRKHVDMIPQTRELMQAGGKPYVIENVPGAPLCAAFILCGTMFGLRTDCGAELWRHRLFETNWDLCEMVPPCAHSAQRRVIGVYGGHGRDRRRVCTVTGSSGGSSVRDGTQQFSTEARSQAMGIDWMTGTELSQAIPPAYTEWIGRQLMEVIK